MVTNHAYGARPGWRSGLVAFLPVLLGLGGAFACVGHDPVHDPAEPRQSDGGPGTNGGPPNSSTQSDAGGAAFDEFDNVSRSDAGAALGADGGVLRRDAGTPSEVRRAMATHFDGMGTPGGCGVPPPLVDSEDYVALDVEYTPYPKAYTMDSRPIADTSLLGLFDNGRNCGRWLEVTIGAFCTGTNSGSDGQSFCTGSWVDDELSGATLEMLVADSCQDTNGWCRDDFAHLDLNTPSLAHFVKNGASVGTALSDKWNNRRIAWHFIAAPHPSGDVKIAFVSSAQTYWPAVVLTNLPNGLHGVERRVGGAWRRMPMLSDNGQVYVLASKPFVSGEEPPYEIRLYDADDQLVQGGRVYAFDLPCAGTCSTYTPVTYTTSP